MLTLTEVSQRTGISMPTLQRYKKNYQRRIPSRGKGRSQRYPVEALEVFEEIKKENISKRGRPKKAKAGNGRKNRSAAKTRKTSSSRQGRKRTSKPSEDGEQLLTLTEIGKRTKISYPTLSRYVKKHSKELRSEGTGRSRRFYPETVEVFNRIRSQSKRGRTSTKTSSGSGGKSSTKAARQSTTRQSTGSGDGGLGRDVMKRLAAIEKQLNSIEKQLTKPVQLTLRRQ